MNNIFISICIPNYKRPKDLDRLLNTIDSVFFNEIEIVICDDKSPNINEIKIVVDKFKKNTKYKFTFIENNENFGFDRNLRELINYATGEWIVYMGNDDEFIPGSLDKLICFLKANSKLGFVLKSHYFIHKNNKLELFRYYKGDIYFDPGINGYLSFFRKSVFISGFTIKRDYVKDFMVDNFDGTLLFQLYLLSEVCLNYPSAYFDVPLTQQHDEGIPEFGNSENERTLYTPGSVTVENSIHFLEGFSKITEFIDDKYNLNSTRLIKNDMSKYFYPSLAIQRDKGIIKFIDYVRRLNKIGFNSTLYYYVYIIGLLFFGKNICNNVIRILKNILGKTPKL